MKILLALLISFSTFAHEGGERMGGQSGSGTNGCWIRWSSKYWQTIEELTYQENFEEYFSDMGNFPQRPRARFLISENDIELHDMTRLIAFKNARSMMTSIKASLPNVHYVLQDLSNLFKMVHVVNVNSNGLFNADVSALKEKCHKFSPVILTFKDGAIVIFAPTWNKLEATSYEIMFVHETLRFAQMFHPAFKDLKDSELQHITSLFFNKDKLRDLTISLRKIETKLSLKKWEIPYEGELDGSVAEVLWKIHTNDALKDGDPLGQRAVAFKLINSVYSNHILKNIQKFISRP